MVLSLRVLGEFSLLDSSGQELPLPSRKARALLGYLSANLDQPQPRNRLMNLLWGDSGEQQARHSLNQALATIRKLTSDQYEGLLDSSSERVTLNGDAVELDLVKFHASRAHAPAKACALYKGPFLDGLFVSEASFEEWLTATRAELQALASDAFERAADGAATNGEIAGAIEFTQQLIKLDPLREEAHRRLMRLLYDNGDRAGAVRQFQACSELLQKELNVGPDAATMELFTKISADKPATQTLPSTDAPDRQQKRSSIAILPFANLSGDTDLDALADGLVEDTIAGLERFHVISVISKTSSNQYRDERPNARVIGSDLGAAYLMEGSIRKAGNFVRISAQLIEAATDQQLWAERYDRPLDNPFDLQDEVSAAVIASIEPVLIKAELRKGRQAEPGFGRHAKASEAAWHLYRFTKDNNAKAIKLLEEVIAESPNVAGRHEALAMGHIWDLSFGWSSNPTYSLERGLAAAQRAVELEPDDVYKMSVLAWAYSHAGDWGRAFATIERAIEIHPASAVPHGVKAWMYGHYGEAQQAIQSLELMLARTTESPFISRYLCGGALGHLALEAWEDAARLSEQATVRRPNDLTGWVIQIVAYHKIGDEAEAARRFLNLVELNSNMTLDWLRAIVPIRPAELRETVFSTLRTLGMPER